MFQAPTGCILSCCFRCISSLLITFLYFPHSYKSAKFKGPQRPESPVLALGGRSGCDMHREPPPTPLAPSGSRCPSPAPPHHRPVSHQIFTINRLKSLLNAKFSYFRVFRWADCVHSARLRSRPVPCPRGTPGYLLSFCSRLFSFTCLFFMHTKMARFSSGERFRCCRVLG